MRLPISFFDSKMHGDIMQRIGDHSRIQSFLTGTLLSIVMSLVTFAIYSVVMGAYDMSILGVFLLGSALYVTWILLFMKRRRKLDYMRFQEAAANPGPRPSFSRGCGFLEDAANPGPRPSFSGGCCYRLRLRPASTLAPASGKPSIVS